MNPNNKLALNLLALAAGMAMLAYASVPLYRLFCATTGYGGTTQRAVIAPGTVSDRVITITFNADIDPALNWEFTPGEKEHKVRVGQQALTFYTVKNRDSVPVAGHAVYNVVPFKAGQYFTKIDCFCFEDQMLPANKTVNMPISFFLDPALLDDRDMDDVKTITLSYTFFPVKK